MKGKEIKKRVRIALSLRWGGPVVLTALLLALSLLVNYFTLKLAGSSGSLSLYLSLGILLVCSVLMSVLYAGESRYYLHLFRREEGRVRDLFSLFMEKPDRFLSMGILQAAVVLLFTAPLLIVLFSSGEELASVLLWGSIAFAAAGGVILLLLFLNLFPARFILLDHPTWSVTTAYKQSLLLMRGNRLRLFRFLLSFLGWIFPLLMTMAVGALWIRSYLEASLSCFYLDLLGEKIPDTPLTAAAQNRESDFR